ncbi:MULTISPECIES: nitrous oxide reductase family maturation protein NosD [Myxococcaceae]|uniref:right-handed parallel beta-helix repeat-containing protein n=1 Tax=Myxococcaceae TaxID=31 RepID=UPI00188F4DFB|nr:MULTISPECIES: right-handed parallel beta-helix repeat-containing protein [Myxococcaceae]MBF5041760.1 right-handed parallel beta-helix repeat-containing protein [Simulacricoccus sp. 17bor-14]
MHLRSRLLGLLILTSGALSACQQGGGADTQSPDPLGGEVAAPGTGTGTGNTPVTTPTSPTTPPAPPAPAVKYTREWVVAPTGSDSSAGSAAAPFRTIGKALSVVGPGERITVKAGTYAERISIESTVKAGTQSAPIRLQGEGMPRIIPGNSAWSMINVRKPYWQIDGFEVDAQGQNKAGVVFADATTTGSVLSGSKVHNGTAGAAVSTVSYATGVTIENNEIYDYWIDGTDSHGVLVEYSSKNITVRGNKIHNVSGDSVQCIGPEDYSTLPPADTVLIEGNEMYSNFENAFDIKTCSNVTIRGNVMRDFDAAGVVHMSASNVLIEDNLITGVGKGIQIGGNHYGPVPTHIVVRRNRIQDVHLGSATWEGNGIRLENCEDVLVANNTVVGAVTAALRLGGGEGGATSNLKVYNNILQGAETVRIGSQAPGLVLGNNLYASTAKINLSGAGVLSFSSWMSRGLDSGSVEAPLQLSTDGKFTPGSAAIDHGRNLGLAYCGAGPDIGAVETGC